MIDGVSILASVASVGMMFIAITRVREANSIMDEVDEIYGRACEVKLETDSMVEFREMTFCACESCKNRECPRRLTRLTIADAVRMGVPVRVDNFADSCADYTCVDESLDL